VAAVPQAISFVAGLERQEVDYFRSIGRIQDEPRHGPGSPV